MPEKCAVLIVEDDKNMLGSYEANFRFRLEYHPILTAGSKNEALEHIGRRSPKIGVAVCDVRIPSAADGIDVIRALQNEGINVIVLSGTTEDLPSEVRAGCAEVMLKQNLSQTGISPLIERVKALIAALVPPQEVES